MRHINRKVLDKAIELLYGILKTLIKKEKEFSSLFHKVTFLKLNNSSISFQSLIFPQLMCQVYL